MLAIDIAIFILGFVMIWYGAGLILTAASKFSAGLKLSPFAFSFVYLGLLTSTPEFAVGLRSVAEDKAPVFVGNLLGGILVLFLVVIPLLAVFGNGIRIKSELNNRTLLATLAVILAPALFLLDNRLTLAEGIFFIASYIGLLYLVERHHGIFDRSNARLLDIKAYSYKDLLRIVAGVALTYLASTILLDKTIYFGSLLGISAFYMGLLVVAIGTDLPELSLAIKSVLSGTKEIAMGDYIGAAAASTLMFGIFTLMSGGEIVTGTSFALTFGFITAALAAYYYIFRTSGVIKRHHGIAMFGLYLVFFVVEILKS